MSHHKDGNALSLTQGNETDKSHPIFSQDPSQWLSLLHCQVCVFTEDGHKHCGWVYTIDPVSQSVVLIDHPHDDFAKATTISMNLLMGSSISSIDLISPEPSEKVKEFCDRLFRPGSNVSLSEEEIVKRRARLKSWLEKHRLPVEVGGHDGRSLIVAEALVIQPPFSEDSCLSTNEIILSKIQGLIKIMPDEDDSD